MANRRMFSYRATESKRFLKMPATSQSLYFHLGMHADDGIVETYPVMCLTRAREDDLKILISKGFVSMITDDLAALRLTEEEIS